MVQEQVESQQTQSKALVGSGWRWEERKSRRKEEALRQRVERERQYLNNAWSLWGWKTARSANEPTRKWSSASLTKKEKRVGESQFEWANDGGVYGAVSVYGGCLGLGRRLMVDEVFTGGVL